MRFKVEMLTVLKSLIIVVVAFHIASGYEDYDQLDEHVKEQFMNLQAAQRGINKKSDDQVVPRLLSGQELDQALSELKQEYTEVPNWPTPTKKLGAVSAVALDVYNNVVVFHRAERVWGSNTFNPMNVFNDKSLGPIKENTLITFDRESGKVLSEWGGNLFYMPHGLHIRGSFYYITDVGLHQVFRFNIDKSTQKPELTIGEAFKPGNSAKLFCKPTSVASLENGDFFVADGYCNGRIVKYNSLGEKILEWGKNTFSGNSGLPITPPNSFAIPHALTLVPDKQLLCVADRENGRIQCFSWTDGTFYKQYHSQIVGDRIFSVDYSNGTLFVVNGPQNNHAEVRGYTFDMDSGDVTSKFGEFRDPHDLAVTPDAKEIFVGDLSAVNPATNRRIYKLMLNGLKPTFTSGDSSVVPPAKYNVRRGDTALLVGSIVLLFTIFTIGMAVLISRKQRRGSKIFAKPWDRTSKNIFYDYNQFEKIPQNDDFATECQNEVA